MDMHYDRVYYKKIEVFMRRNADRRLFDLTSIWMDLDGNPNREDYSTIVQSDRQHRIV